MTTPRNRHHTPGCPCAHARATRTGEPVDSARAQFQSQTCLQLAKPCVAHRSQGQWGCWGARGGEGALGQLKRQRCIVRVGARALPLCPSAATSSACIFLLPCPPAFSGATLQLLPLVPPAHWGFLQRCDTFPSGQMPLSKAASPTHTRLNLPSTGVIAVLAKQHKTEKGLNQPQSLGR